MPNFSGTWTTKQQMQARGASTWPAPPGAPTIGTATAGSNKCASVTFTAPACTGKFPSGVTGYLVTSTPGCFTATGASSPLTVTGLTAGTSYTFKAQATNGIGYGGLSAASNSITATLVTCATYTTPGTYSWVAPTGVTSVAVVTVGAGGGNKNWSCCGRAGGGGGALAYKNAQAVTPGSSYTVTVGAFTSGAAGGASTFINTSTVSAGGGRLNCLPTNSGGLGGLVVAGTGGAGGNGGSVGGAAPVRSGGGGAGGYAGAGGAGGSSTGAAGSGGGGGGGARRALACGQNPGKGGGVGIFGQGSNGAGGTSSTCCTINGSPGSGGSGVTYGGGQCGSANGSGGVGAVRIVWCKCGARGTPSFPSTNVGA